MGHGLTVRGAAAVGLTLLFAAFLAGCGPHAVYLVSPPTTTTVPTTTAVPVVTTTTAPSATMTAACDGWTYSPSACAQAEVDTYCDPGTYYSSTMCAGAEANTNDTPEPDTVPPTVPPATLATVPPDLTTVPAFQQTCANDSDLCPGTDPGG